MRVIAGKYKSRPLKAVAGQKTRPTTDKNKESLFNMIGPYFNGGICLDLFGGCGGLGIEALSRGMDELYSVDHQYQAYQTIKENIATLHIEKDCHVYKMDYRKALALFKEKGVCFDLVLLDPPYGLKINESIIMYLKENKMLEKESTIVIEDLKEERLNFNEPFYLKKEQVYGKTIMQILEYEE